MAQNGLFGTPFDPKTTPQREFMWVTFLRSFPGNEAHQLFSLDLQWGIWGGGQEIYRALHIYYISNSKTFYSVSVSASATVINSEEKK